MRGNVRHTVSLGLLVLALWPVAARAGFTLTPGHLYATNADSGLRTITEYAPDGTRVGSLDVAPAVADNLRGITFGPDGLLYATAVRGSGFAVVALDAAGSVHQTYALDAPYIEGNISNGKIAIAGTAIYVAGQSNLMKFSLGSPGSGQYIHGSVGFDVAVLPTGNLLVPKFGGIEELSPDGATVRRLPIRTTLFDVRGIAYDAATDRVFVTDYADSSNPYLIRRINPATGEVEKSVRFTYGDDLFLTQEGNLLVGSRIEAPRLYSKDLVLLDTLDGPPQLFVTQFAVPEPCAIAAAAVVLGVLLLRRDNRPAPSLGLGLSQPRSWPAR